MSAPLRSVNVRKFSWLCNDLLKSLQDWLNSNAKQSLQKMLARKCSYRGKHVKD